MEEQPCFDPNDVYDIPMEETIKDLANVNDSTDNVCQKDCLKFDFETLERKILKVALIKLFQEQKVLY